jgi:hypothetical protein
MGLQTVERTADAQLTRSASISGRITQDNSPLAYRVAYIDLFDANRIFQRGYSTVADVNGNYRLDDLPAGDHFIGISVSGTFAQLYNGVDCPLSSGNGAFSACAFGQARLITNADNRNESGINFNLLSQGARRVHVVDIANGAPLGNVSIDVWRTTGTRVATSVTAANGIASVSMDYNLPAMYSISTDNAHGFIDEVYDDRACPLGSAYLGQCSLLGASTIALPATEASLAAIEIGLSDGDGLFGSSFESP